VLHASDPSRDRSRCDRKVPFIVVDDFDLLRHALAMRGRHGGIAAPIRKNPKEIRLRPVLAYNTELSNNKNNIVCRPQTKAYELFLKDSPTPNGTTPNDASTDAAKDPR
jgi:hypothetical protein